MNNEELRAQALGTSLEAPAEEVQEPIESTRGLLSGSLHKPGFSTTASRSSPSIHSNSTVSQTKTYGASSPISTNTSFSSTYTTPRIPDSKVPSVTRVTPPTETTSSIRTSISSLQPSYNASTSSTVSPSSATSSTTTSTAIPYNQFRSSLSRLCKPTAASIASQKPSIPYVSSGNRQNSTSLRTSMQA